ncbi:MAG: hypothetical protein BGO98_48645 [Myxococcales bacterium 68-20]|nr:hypothetical protein [Myxococcales bacterium]OJY29700.1 MAG: hypothetical protein BGO98_48645 [Myxococcales bacterium 68-20]
MLHTSKPRLAFFMTAASIAAASLISACADDATSTPTGGTDKPDASTSKDKDSGSTDDTDADTDTDKDAGTKPGKDANGPGADGDECTLNRDCQSALRCECDEATGCFCKPGTRGTGKNGVDPCDSGNQCESSLCVEGPTNGESFCSDECKDDTECGGQLPQCLPIPGLGAKICTREPPK